LLSILVAAVSAAVLVAVAQAGAGVSGRGALTKIGPVRYSYSVQFNEPMIWPDDFVIEFDTGVSITHATAPIGFACSKTNVPAAQLICHLRTKTNQALANQALTGRVTLHGLRSYEGAYLYLLMPATEHLQATFSSGVPSFGPFPIAAPLPVFVPRPVTVPTSP
jgi:hypothetical protein